MERKAASHMKLFDKLKITTTSFENLGRIPDEFTADGGNVEPTLMVEGVPEGTVELAIIAHDPDAPLPHGFTHWTIYGVPADANEVNSSMGRVGPRSFGDIGYMGPKPPAGHGEHHYYFWVYALNRPVEGEPTREEFLSTYTDAIIEQARVVGTDSN